MTVAPRLARIAAVLFAVLLLAGGCATPVSVAQLDQRAAYRQFDGSALSGDRLSERTRNVLRRWDLLDRFDSDQQGAIAALRGLVVAGQGGPPELFALAEMSYLHGRETGNQADDLAAAVYAYAFLFPGSRSAPPDPFDPRFREACDLYNLSLSSALASADGSRVVLRSGSYPLPFGTIDVTTTRPVCSGAAAS